MRAPLVVAVASLTLYLGPGPVRAEPEGGDLAWIHMIDSSKGWALNHQCCFIAPAEISDARGGLSQLLRTTDGGIHWKDVMPPDPEGRPMAQSSTPEGS